MQRRSVRAWLVLLALGGLCWVGTERAGLAVDRVLALAPAHERPFLLPDPERARIRGLIAAGGTEQSAYERAKERARNGDPFLSAFFYAVTGDPAYLPAARDWLLEYADRGGDIFRVQEHLNDPNFFKGGQHDMQQVYYHLNAKPLLAYDWIYQGLARDERRRIENGILTSARFRMRSMDRWTQTPNLVYKPTWMVAAAGLVTQDRDALEWGFFRKPGSPIGGYFSAMDVMLKDGGPWAEAPAYPILNQDLLLMIRMSRYLKLVTGKDWFDRKTPAGGSPKGLMDYYIDTAYPIEQTGYGKGQIRIANYGDAATDARGDLFLVNPAGPGRDMHEELAAAYGVSADPRYAAFLELVQNYEPDVVEDRPLPGSVELPAAPSKVWPSYGLAMLRSDEAPSYWTSGKAIAVFQLMTQGYGHDHRDKLSIMLHGAGRLLYPDYNTVQYENPSIGWTRNTIAHNTMMVDEQETRDAIPTAIRHEFSPHVKFLATSASGVFEGVDQTRALFLTSEYLLDVFRGTSRVPHTYDYLLHSFGRPQPVTPRSFGASDSLGSRYWEVKERRSLATDAAWSLDFVLDEAAVRNRETNDSRVIEERARARKRRAASKRPSETHFGPQWYEHRAAVRVHMAGEPGTLVAYGYGPQEMPTLVVRRRGIADTVFVATHEPFANGAAPKVTGVSELARTRTAVIARVESAAFTDYAAVTLGPDSRTEQVLAAPADSRTVFAFRNYGYLRVGPKGGVAARGGWSAFRIPGARGPVTLNGKPVAFREADGYLEYGSAPHRPESSLHASFGHRPVRGDAARSHPAVPPRPALGSVHCQEHPRRADIRGAPVRPPQRPWREPGASDVRSPAARSHRPSPGGNLIRRPAPRAPHAPLSGALPECARRTPNSPSGSHGHHWTGAGAGLPLSQARRLSSARSALHGRRPDVCGAVHLPRRRR